MRNSRNLANSSISVMAKSTKTLSDHENEKKEQSKRAYSTLAQKRLGTNSKLISGSQSTYNIDVRSTNGYAVSRLRQSQRNNINSSFYVNMKKIILTKEQRQEILKSLNDTSFNTPISQS